MKWHFTSKKIDDSSRQFYMKTNGLDELKLVLWRTEEI
jgi:hypothetical protein